MEASASGKDRLSAIERDLAKGRSQLLANQSTPHLGREMVIRTARTAGDSYPSQTSGKGARVPIVFTDVLYDSGETDPVFLLPRSLNPQAWLHCPWGWLPKGLDLEVRLQRGHEQSDIWICTVVPDLEVEFVDSVSSPGSGTVRVVQHGDMDDVEFDVYVDHMAGSRTVDAGTEAIVRLWPGSKRWEAVEVAC